LFFSSSSSSDSLDEGIEDWEIDLDLDIIVWSLEGACALLSSWVICALKWWNKPIENTLMYIWYNRLDLLNISAFLSGLISSFGLFFLGIVSLGISFWTHGTFALIFFCGNFVQIEAITLLSYFIFKRRAKLNLTIKSTARFWYYWKVVNFILCVICLPVNGPILVIIIKRKFDFSDPDLFDSIGICQYFYIFFMLLWVSSVGYNLRNNKMNLLFQKIRFTTQRDKSYHFSQWEGM